LLGFKALDLANRFERAALAEELRARRHVLPVKQQFMNCAA